MSTPFSHIFSGFKSHRWNCILFVSKVKKKAKVRNLYNYVTHMTQDTVWYEKVTKTTIKHHIQGSQEVSPFPTGDHKAARNRHGMQDTLNPA